MKTIKEVLDNNLCIGCGACTVNCKSNVMELGEQNIYRPKLSAIDELDIDVCPFSDNNKEIVNVGNSSYLGKYLSLGVGYSHANRNNSSSGGIGSWLLSTLLEKQLIQGIICVAYDENAKPGYKIVNSQDDIKQSAGTKYYPLTLEQVIKELKQTDGDYALTGIPCFINSTVLLEKKYPEIFSKIKYRIGIFCGGLKSTSFTEYLATRAGADKYLYEYPVYRNKSNSTNAIDYSFSVNSSEGNAFDIKMKEVGDMWGTGMFKPTACEFCEDLCAENADISLGDAWIKPYMDDPLGHNVIIVRDDKVSKLIQEGIAAGELSYNEISEDLMCQTQQGNINHRRIGLSYRLFKNKKLTGHLNTSPNFPLNITIPLVQEFRNLLRKKSHSLWESSDSIFEFEHKIKPYKSALIKVTKLNHMFRRIGSKLNITK